MKRKRTAPTWSRRTENGVVKQLSGNDRIAVLSSQPVNGGGGGWLVVLLLEGPKNIIILIL